MIAGQPVHALGAGDVEQYAARDEVRHLVDAAEPRAGVGGDGVGGAAVVDLSRVRGVGERVPVGGCLEAHRDGVVAGGDRAGAEELLVDLHHRVEGLIRPGIRPVWTPSSLSGSASGMRLPVRMVAAASRTTSSVMRLRVPISSSEPQRPQLFTRLAMSWNSGGRADAGVESVGPVGAESDMGPPQGLSSGI